MVALKWDEVGKRRIESGVDHGVLFPLGDDGAYDAGVSWSGLTAVTESPSGAESNKQYADNIVYVNLQSAEEFTVTIEAFTYPDEFAECNGEVEAVAGVFVGQQRRRPFGFSYRTLIGNDVAGQRAGYKIHLVYGGIAAPSEKANTTLSDSPEPLGLSWEVTTTPAEVGVVGGKEYSPTAHLVIDSTVVDADALAEFEEMLYGSTTATSALPDPADVIALFEPTP